MNALQVMERYWKKGDTSEYIKELYKGSVSLKYLGLMPCCPKMLYPSPSIRDVIYELPLTWYSGLTTFGPYMQAMLPTYPLDMASPNMKNMYLKFKNAKEYNTCNGWKVWSNRTTSVPRSVPRLVLDKVIFVCSDLRYSTPILCPKSKFPIKVFHMS